MKKDLDELEERKLLIDQEEKASRKRIHEEEKASERRIHEEKEIQEEIFRKERDSAMLEVEKKAKIVEEEKRDWEIEKTRVKATKTFEKIVILNVGGSKYTTTLSTLTKYQDSMLGAMFSGRHALVQQEDGSYFIDRDGESFRYILMYLRDDRLARAIIPKLDTKLLLQLTYDAEYFQLPELAKLSEVFANVVTLNVGGSRYTTTLSTLTKYPDSMLGTMFSGRHALVQQEDGSYFIDRDREVFSHVLSYLRDSNIVLALVPTFARELRLRLKDEARFYQLQELEATLGLMDLGKDFIIPADERINFYKWEAYVLDYKSTLSTGMKGKADLPIYHYIDDVIKVEMANVKMSQPCNTCFLERVTFLGCNLAGVSFENFYFEEPVSFEGCLMQGAIFKSVGGLVTHKVHFTPWQVSQAVFDPELLEALEAKGCIY